MFSSCLTGRGHSRNCYCAGEWSIRAWMLLVNQAESRWIDLIGAFCWAFSKKVFPPTKSSFIQLFFLFRLIDVLIRSAFSAFSCSSYNNFIRTEAKTLQTHVLFRPSSAESAYNTCCAWNVQQKAMLDKWSLSVLVKRPRVQYRWLESLFTSRVELNKKIQSGLQALKASKRQKIAQHRVLT